MNWGGVSTNRVDIILASFETDAEKNPKPSTLRQDQWSDIYVQITSLLDTSGGAYYRCALGIEWLNSAVDNPVVNHNYAMQMINSTTEKESG